MKMFFFIFISNYLFIYLSIYLFINCTMNYETQTKIPYLKQKMVLLDTVLLYNG
jgi:hypothetical protein